MNASALPLPAARPVDHLRAPGPEADSFYHLAGCALEDRPCDGTACFLARQAFGLGGGGGGAGPRVHCLGRCFAAPVTGLDRARPAVAVRSREPVVLARLARNLDATLPAYEAAGGGALHRALAGPPEHVLREITASELRGRGGAGFPTGRKWLAAAEAPTPDEKFIVANADEGDPGAYVDRFLMEGDPHALLEGMTLAAFAVGARRGWIYLRREYPFARAALERALAERRAAGLLGEGILGTAFSFDLEIFIGQGSYVCGEETALLRSLAGQRPEVMLRPPYATTAGLFQRPTVINNVETLATVPWIVAHGGAAYRALGFSRSRGTKVLSLNSLFVRPGLYEVEFGMPLREIVEDLGGGLRTGALKGVIVGGPLAGLIPPWLLDTPLGFEELRAIGAEVGHGGVLAFDEHLPIAELLRHVFAFGAYESCGKCTPCRLGAGRVGELLSGPPGEGSAAALRALVDVLGAASLCGHGTGLGQFAASALRHYGKELFP